MRRFAWVVMMLLVLPAYSFALQPLATDDAGTMGMAKFQFEVSSEFDWDKANGVRTNQQQLGFTLTAGVLDSVDLVVGVPLRWQQQDGGIDNGGLADMSLALKWRLLELGPLSMAVKPVITIPTGDYNKGLGASRTSYGATLISTVEFKPVAVHANLGYTKFTYTDTNRAAGREDQVSLSLAGVVSVSPKLQLVAEVGTASYSSYSDKLWPGFVTAGASYALSDKLSLSLGGRFGLTNTANDAALLAGVTFAFP